MVLASKLPPHRAQVVGWSIKFLSASPRVNPTGWAIPMDRYDISIAPVEGAGNVKRFFPDVRHHQGFGMGQVVRVLFDHVAFGDHLLDVVVRNLSKPHTPHGMRSDEVAV